MPDVADFRQDPENANLGTPEGQVMIRESIEGDGFGRPILVDANDVIVAGSKTQIAAIEAGLQDAVVVESTGDKVIVHKRTDLHTDDPRRIRLAVRDNRAGQLNLLWDMDRVVSFQARGVDFSKMWDPGELPPSPPTIDDYPDVQEDPELYEHPDGTISTTPPDNGVSVTRQGLGRDDKTYHVTFDLEYDDSLFVQRALTEWSKTHPGSQGAFLVQMAEIYLASLQGVKSAP